MVQSLPTYPHFDLLGDYASLSQRWVKWIRGFNTLLVGLNITNSTTKRVLLLYYAGEVVHDLFTTLPNIGGDDDLNAVH